MAGTFPALIAVLLLAVRQLADPAVRRVLGKSAGLTLVLFALLAAAGWLGLDAILKWGGLHDAAFRGAGGLRALAAALLVIGGLWLIWRLVAMAVIQFFAAEVVEAVERRHYPAAALVARAPGLAAEARAALASVARAVLFNLATLPLALVLLFTGIGPMLVFWMVNAALIGRDLQDMVWLRHCHGAGAACPVSGLERLVLGGVVAALMAVPFVNLLAPVLGAAAATHLIHRKGGN